MLRLTQTHTHLHSQTGRETDRLLRPAQHNSGQTDMQYHVSTAQLSMLVAYTRLGASICGQHMPDVQQSTTVVNKTPSETVASDKAPLDTVLSSLMYSASSNMSSRGSFSMDCTVSVMRGVQTAATYIPGIHKQQQSQCCTLLDTSDLQRFELGRVSSSPKPTGPP